MLSNEEGNQLIKNYLKDNKIFSVGRVGSSELLASNSFDSGQEISGGVINMLQNNAGVYGNSIKDFCKEYLEGIKCSDIQVYWAIDGIKSAQNNLFSKYCSDSTIVDSRTVEPFYFNDSWAGELKGKKVLVISPFAESIKTQYENRLLIWPNKLLPEFDLVPYKAVQSIGGIGPHSCWFESLNIMKEEINDLDFDVALLGCGGYGMPLIAHIKNVLNKSAIYVGGGLQILFGIKGRRWDTHPEISSFYNEHWIRPNDNEKPKGMSLMNNEPSTYW